MGEASEARQPGARSTRARPALPVVPVSSREDMAIMLARNNRLLRDYARLYMTGHGEDAVEEAVGRTVDWLLGIAQPSYPNGLRYATKALWRECQRTECRLQREGVPVDRKLGPLTGATGRAVERLGARARDTVLQAAQGRTSAQIAEAQNSSPAAVRIRLHYARKRVKQFLSEGRLTASGLALAVQRETRGPRHRALAWWQRRGSALSWPTGDPLVQVAAITAAAAVTAVGSASVSLATPNPMSAVTSIQTTLGAAPGNAAADGPRPDQLVAAARVDASNGGIVVTSFASAMAPGNTLPPLLGNQAPGDETPEDAQLMTAAAAADYGTTHTIVALGQGHSCRCPVLFQSTDGGANWTASNAAAPPASEQVALPPTYPADPRIFIGTNPQSGGSTYVIPRFGEMGTALTGPPGHLALSAGFDHGDNRVFVAAQEAVVSLAVDATPPQLVPVLMYPQWFSGTASVATPASAGAAVMVLAPPGTMVVDDPSSGETQATTVFICSADTTCVRRGSPPVQAATLTASPSDAVSAASWGAGVAVSPDGGQSFQTPAVPASVTSIQSVAAASGRVWALMRHGGTVAVAWSPAVGGSWVDVTAADNSLSHSLSLIAIPGGPVLDLLSGRGLRCTVDGGLAWASRCP